MKNLLVKGVDGKRLVPEGPWSRVFAFLLIGLPGSVSREGISKVLLALVLREQLSAPVLVACDGGLIGVAQPCILIHMLQDDICREGVW